jgi:hypothetical protein
MTKQALINCIFFISTLCISCSSELRKPIIGTWRCEKVERIERPAHQSMAISLGEEMVLSEKISDTLILQSDNTYEECISAFCVNNNVKGSYNFSASDRNLKLLKNVNSNGSARSKEYSIIKLTEETLILKDDKKFTFHYLRLKTK